MEESLIVSIIKQQKVHNNYRGIGSSACENDSVNDKDCVTVYCTI